MYCEFNTQAKEMLHFDDLCYISTIFMWQDMLLNAEIWQQINGI